MRSKNLSRLLAAALILALLCSCMPAALAAEPEPEEPAGYAEPAGAETPAEPEDPADPADAVDPADPADPADPETPADPEEPETPADPVDPAEPDDPADPADPETPEDPEDPEEGEEADAEEPEEEEPEEDALPESFAGLPEDYVFSAAELSAKRELNEQEIPALIGGMEPGVDYVPGELLLSAETEEQALLAAEAYGAELLRWENGLAVLALGEGTVPQAVAAGAAEDGEKLFPPVEPNYIFTTYDPVSFGGAKRTDGAKAAGDVPTALTWQDWIEQLDDEFLQDPADPCYPWMHDRIHTWAAWGVTTGNRGIVVAVVDSGVDPWHEELDGRILAGYDFIDFDEDPSDEYGHGTHVAGIIAAAMNNGFGGAGIAPGVSILPVRVLNSRGGGTSASVIEGIDYAVERGAQIINLSLSDSHYSFTLREAIERAYAANVTVVAAMGNQSANMRVYPAAYDHVIAVAAVNRDGSRADFSNYGAWCDLAAPGVDIWSSVPTSFSENYASMNGTSMATPVVAGAAALYMSVYGNPGPDAMEKALKAAVTKGSGSGIGKGVIDLLALFGADKAAPDVFLRDAADAAGEAAAPVQSSCTASRDQILLVRSGSEAAPDGANTPVILYTDSGKAPAVLNGAVTRGAILNESGEIPLSGYAVGKTVTFKFREVNAAGAVGKIRTVKVKIVKASGDEILENLTVTIAAPQTLLAGKSVTLKASVTSSYTEWSIDPETGEPVGTLVEDFTGVDQGVTWVIAPDFNSAGASIDAKTGRLTTKAGTAGSVIVVAASKIDPNKTGYAEIVVEAAAPVAAAAFTGAQSVMYTGEEQALELALADAAGEAVDPASVEIRWSSSAPKVAAVDQNGAVTALSKGTATITAAVNDGSGKKASVKLTVKQAVTDVAVKGNPAVAPGKSGTYTVTVTPSSASLKTVAWTVTDTDGNAVPGVSITSKGVLKVGAGVPAGTRLILRAEAKDGRGAYGEFTVLVRRQAVSVAVWTSEDLIKEILDKKGNVTGAWLYTLNVPNTMEEAADGSFVERDDTTLQLNARITLPDGYDYSVVWSSSKPKVASVDSSGSVTALSAGTTTITAKAADGSGKKAGFTIKVVVPVSTMSVLSKRAGGSAKTGDRVLADHILAYGKSVTNKAVPGSTYGKPTVTKVIWDYDVYPLGDPDAPNPLLTLEMQERKLATVSSGGKLTLKAGARELLGTGYGIRVTATAMDGTGRMGYVTYMPVEPVSALGLYDYKGADKRKSVTLDRYDPEGEQTASEKLDVLFAGGTDKAVCVRVSSSKPDVAGARLFQERRGSETVTVLEIIPGAKAGTAKITVAACDGSGKTVTLTVKVR